MRASHRRAVRLRFASTRQARVLADRQVSPTVLSSSRFCHACSLRGKFGSVNFRLCSRRRFTLTRQGASTRQAAFTSFRRGQRATTVHFNGSTTLQPKRSNGVVSRVTIRWPRERTMAAMSESRRGSGPFAWAVISPQIAAARVSKFNTRYFRGRSVANLLMLL